MTGDHIKHLWKEVKSKHLQKAVSHQTCMNGGQMDDVNPSKLQATGNQDANGTIAASTAWSMQDGE
jgi:hypothetical protein